MKVVLWGARGQLGQQLLKTLPGDVIGLTRADADLTDAPRVHACLDHHRPDVVINCAAYNFVDRAEEHPQEAFAVNTLAVRDLARWCGERDCLLVHFSTDHVFGLDATRDTPYPERAAPGPVNVYGQSKLCGEYWARSLCARHLVVRTCGLYGLQGDGGKGRNFPDTMLRLAEQGEPIRVVSDQICTPTFVADLADAVGLLLQLGANGLYHWTNSGQCSWYEFARGVFASSQRKVAVEPITTAEYGAAARRPRYSVLDMGVWETLRLPAPRPWQAALDDYLRQRKGFASALTAPRPGSAG